MPAAATGQCGEERWTVKTGTDADVSRVNTGQILPVSIGALTSLPKPSSLPENSRIAETELSVMAVYATLTVCKLEEDSD